MAISLRPARGESDWTSALAAAGAATPFHEWEWLQLQADLAGLRVVSLIVQDGDQPLGVFPILTRVGRAVRSLPPTFPYLGPLVPPERLPAVLRAFRRWQMRSGLLDVHFELRFTREDAAEELAAVVTDVRVEQTYVIDLAHGSESSVLAGLNRNTKRKLRAAEQAGVEVRASTEQEIAEVLPRVLAEAFQRHGGSSPYTTATGSKLARFIRARGAYAATALHEGRPVGIRVGLERGPLALDALGAGLIEFRELEVDAALTMHHLRWALERGYETLDLAGHVDEGVQRFKRGFGADHVTYLAARSAVAPRLLQAAGALRGLAARA